MNKCNRSMFGSGKSALLRLGVCLGYLGLMASAQAVDLSGRLTDNGAGLSGVRINYTWSSPFGSGSGSVTSRSGGNWSSTGWGPFTAVTFRPSQTGYSWSPPSISYNTGVSGNHGGMNFERVSYGISGAVTFPDGAGASGVSVSISGAASRSATTPSAGSFSFTLLPTGNYTITPSKSGFLFLPARRTTSLSPNRSGQDFVMVSAIVNTLPASAVGSTSAVLNGTVAGEGTLTNRVWFQYGTNGLFDSATVAQLLDPDAAMVPVSAPLNGLSAGVTYNYRLVAANANGTNYGGTLVFVPPGPGALTGLSFDGSVNSFLKAPNVDRFPTTNITAELWVRSPALNRPMTYLNYAVPEDDNEFFLYSTDAMTNLNPGVIRSGAVQLDLSGGKTFSDESWHHMAMRWRSSDGALDVFRDGVKIYSTVDYQTGLAMATNGTFVLGQDQDNVGGGFDANQAFIGEMDEVRVWNTFRTDQQIAGNLHSRLSGAEPGLVLYYQMDDALGTMATNSAGGSYAGTLGSGTKFIASGAGVFTPVVETLAATPVLATRATFHATVNPAGSNSVAYFEYGETIAYGSTTSAQDVGAGLSKAPFSASLSDLQPGTTYHFRVVAFNDAGMTVGADQMFTTLVLGVGWPTSTKTTGGYSTSPRHVVDGEGNAYVAGLFSGSATFKTTMVSTNPNPEAFVGKLGRGADWLWNNKIGLNATGSILVNAIGLDAARNVYVAGQFSGTATFGSAVLTSSGPKTDLFVAKLNNTGDTWLWARSAGAAEDDSAKAIAITPGGLVFVAGYFRGSVSFGANSVASAAGSQDGFVAKLNAAGSWLWARAAGGSGADDAALALAVNNVGDAFLAGAFQGTAAFGGTQLTASGGASDTDLFVARISTDGLWLLARRAGSSGADMATGLTIDAAGQLYLLGQFAGTADYNNTIDNLNLGGAARFFVAKLNPNANMLWYAQAGTGYSDSISADNAGHVYISGEFTVSTRFGDPADITLVSSGNSDVFLAQLDAQSGAWTWAKSIGSSGSEFRGSVGVDAMGGVVVSGTFQNTVPVGYVLLSTANERDIFVARLDPEGVFEHNTYVIGQAIPVPVEAQDPDRTDGGAIAQPAITILEKEQADSDPVNSFVWSLSEHKLYPVRAVTATFKWPLTTDVTNTTSVATAVGRTVWPADPQIHIAGTPADLEPDIAGYPYRFVNLAFTTINGAGVEASSKQFTAPQPGWTVLQFLDTGGALPDPNIHPSKFEVVKTVLWDDPAYLLDNQPATIGSALSSAAQNDATGKNGFVFFENAFYDGTGDERAYDRETRTGPIIPVNKDTTAADDDLVVVWYRTNRVTGIAWPSVTIRYLAQWPPAPAQLVLASGMGSGVLDPVEYPSKRVYNQPDPNLPGFNPNEEHAALYGDTLYALRNDLNAIVNASQPYTLLKYRDPITGQWAMKVFRIVSTNANARFVYSGEAGQELQLPPPLSLLPLCGASNLWVSGPGFKDYAGRLYARAGGQDGGGASIVTRYWYPLQPGFFYDLDRDGQADAAVGDCLPWLDRRPGGTPGVPVDVTYNITWPVDVPSLQIGETLLNAKFGLPDLSHFASARVVFDEGDPDGTNGVASLTRLFDPLGARTVQLRPNGATDFVTGPGYGVFRTSDADALLSGISTVNDAGMLVFTDLPYVLRARLRYDPLNKNLIFSGLLDESLDYGGSQNPLLLLNVMDPRERDRIKELSGNPDFGSAIDALYDLSRNPNQLDLDADGSPDTDLLVGLTQNADGEVVQEALADGPKALTAGTARNSGYVTVVENDDPNLGSLPVTLHIMRVSGGPFRGDIKVIKSDNVFDEKLTLRHSGDFGGEPQNFEFEWYYQPAGAGVDPTQYPLTQTNGDIVNLAGWIQYAPASADPTGLNDITLGDGGNSSLLVLADNYFICRYRGYAINGQTNWSDWVGASGGDRAQLAEGWVSRVRDGLNPFEARSAAFHENETVTFASMLQQAGPRYEGDIAFNPAGGNINSIGLIEAYQTVLHRARRLSIEGAPPIDYQPANDALLLAAGFVSDLYMLLGNEAYADAADPTIGFRTDSAGYGTLAPSIFTFQNQVDSLLEEELALLRGRDDRSATVRNAPAYNRLLWNFTRDEGEVAYAQAYNITDQNKDGFINADDARIMYPQGHGDAWGHYLTVTTTYYSLLRNTNFDWVPRTEEILLAGSPVELNYFDERKFARAAAAKAKTGAEIVDLTYRLNYVDDPAGQFQGYKDTDPDRAWGVSEWAHRAGSGAFFDWVTANAILPSTDPDTNHVGIEKIDRGTVLEIDEIAAGFRSVQAQIDKANAGLNPLGIAKNAVPFDIDPTEISNGKTHFEQIYDRALDAVNNTVTVFNHANQLSQALRSLQDSVNNFSRNADEQERDFKNRLIEVFGYPYAGDIGPGRTYPSGYDGPDLYHYMYANTLELNGDTAPVSQSFTAFFTPKPGLAAVARKVAEGPFFFPDDAPTDPGDRYTTNILQISYPYSAADYGFTAPASWGQRRAPGEIQDALSTVVQNQARFKQAQLNYDNLILQIQDMMDLLQARFNLEAEKIVIRKAATAKKLTLAVTVAAARKTQEVLQDTRDLMKDSSANIVDGLPKVVGTASDVFSAVRAGLRWARTAADRGLQVAQNIAGTVEQVAAGAKEGVNDARDIKIDRAGFPLEVQTRLAELEQLIRQEAVLRAEAFTQREVLSQSLGAYQAAVAKGLRLADERAAFRKNAAADTQASRYQDMTFRIFRNDAIQKYRAQFDLAARYVFLAAVAYDFETQLLGGQSGAGRQFLTDIVRQRSLGQIENGVPIAGRHGLADPLARLGQNFAVLKGQLGFNNPQTETGRFSLRNELFRLRDDSDQAWQAELQKRIVPNLWDIPEFRRYCRPFAPESAGPQPGLVIRFPTTVTFGLNYFGWPLGGGDSAYDPTLFATKVRSAGVWFDNYLGSGLSQTPRVYLVPAGADVMRSPSGNNLDTREWRVEDQKIPVPFPIGFSSLNDSTWIPMNDSLSDTYAAIRRFSSFRAYHDSGFFDPGETVTDSRLIGRSVWNTDWMLIIPGGTFLADPDQGLGTFVNSVSDIKIFFQTYAYSGN